MSSFGKDLVQSAREALDIASGKLAPARRYDVEPVDVAEIRRKLGLSQAKFAARFGLSAATVRDWEQGRRVPDRTARAFLKLIEARPKVVADVLRSALAAE